MVLIGIFGSLWRQKSGEALPYYDEHGDLIGHISPSAAPVDRRLPFYDYEGHLIGLITPKASNKIPVRHYDLAGRPIGIIHLESTPLLRAASATAPPALAPAKSATSGIVDSHFAKHIGQHSSIQVSTSHHHAPDPSSGPESDNEPQLWDGWPNGTWTRFYTSQQVQTTSGLEIQWASEAFGPRKGSPSSKTWQRGKTMSRRCLGCIQCFNDFCGISSPPAARGIHISQQLEARCPCGAVLKHQTCGIQWSFHFYASGARLEHSGDHLHPHFTHTISTPARGHSQFAEFQRKPKVPLAISMDNDAPETGDPHFDTSSPEPSCSTAEKELPTERVVRFQSHSSSDSVVDVDSDDSDDPKAVERCSTPLFLDESSDSEDVYFLLTDSAVEKEDNSDLDSAGRTEMEQDADANMSDSSFT
ncbi:hypothetical protein C8J57DRAFT_1299443 [Mycena rebaudengoi]|nr:hypothetical protein C8J57DRAFT_1299443 [Mycena rebaudengoi]